MGFGKLLTRPAPAETDQYRAALSNFQMIIDGQPINYPLSLYGGGMALPGAWRAALMISDALGSVPWDLWREDSDRWVKVTPRPWLLQQPAPPDQRMTTFSSWALDLIWHGNAIALIASRDVDGVPDAVLPIPANQVGVRRIGWEAMSGLPIGAVEYQIAGQPYGIHDLIHIKGPCQPSDVRGFGVLEAHLSGMTTGDYAGTLDLALELQRQARAVSQHGVPTGTLKSDNPDLQQPEADDLKAKWLAAQRDRTVAVLNSTTTFEPLSWNPTEMQLVEARKMSLLETALIFGVQPSALAVEMSNRTYRNDNAEDVKFTKWGLRGHIARFEAALSAAWPDPRLCVRADVDDYTRPDPLTRAQTAQIRIQSRTLLPNEDRASEGLAPIDGGDEFPAPNPQGAPSNAQDPTQDNLNPTGQDDQQQPPEGP